jgi:heme-degrading monooxygenase HmoA
MFSVIFEVHPKIEQWNAYLGYAKMLRPELEQIEGFVDNIRYRSLTRDGWILSLSGWRDEKAVVRWRTMVKHHEIQEKGRSEVLLDYHLRVGQHWPRFSRRAVFLEPTLSDAGHKAARRLCPA